MGARNFREEIRQAGRLAGVPDVPDAPIPPAREIPELETIASLGDNVVPLPTDESVNEGMTRDGRQQVNVNNKERAGRWLREEMGQGPLSGWFIRGGEVVYTPRVGEDGYIPAPEGGEDGPAKVRVMTALELKTAVEIRYAPGVGRQREEKVTDPDTGEEVTRTVRHWEPKMFPMESANQAFTAARMGDGVPNVRALRSVTTTPTVRHDGTILDTPGYDPDTRMMYLPEPGLNVPTVSDKPTPEEVKAARDFLCQIVAEFPFVEDYHRANWFGALFTPAMRAMLPPPYPQFIIDAPAPGSGKSYLATILRTVHGGVFRVGLPSDETEFVKSIMTILLDTTAPVVTFDNVRGAVKSAKYEALLTSSEFDDRVLGAIKSGKAPNDRLWTLTANNAVIDGDLARRSYWVTIDPGAPRPHERTGFRLNLKTWVPANRGKILHAILTVARAWSLAGKPCAKAKRGDEYADWDAAMEGMLSWAGIADNFGVADKRHLDSDEDMEFALFLSAVYEVMGSQSFKMNDLIAKIGDEVPSGWNGAAPTPRIDPAKLPGDLADKWSRANGKAGVTKSLGKWFSNRAGRYVGNLVVRVNKDPKKGNSFRIMDYTTES